MSTSDIATEGDVAAEEAPKKSGAREAIDLFKTVAYALLIALVLRVVLFQPFTIPSASMEPNLYEGDYIIVSKFAYGWSRHSLPFSPPIFSGRILQRGPDRGDIVVFKLPSNDRVDYIKRLIGLPGDRIQVKGGTLFLNGEKVPRVAEGTGPALCPFGPVADSARFRETLPGGKTYVTNDCTPNDGGADNTAVYTVPAGCYFMMGDNRDNSLDSRFDPGLIPAGSARCAWDPSVDDKLGGGEPGVGFVPAENLEGKADLILFSWTKGASLFKPWTWVLNARPSRWLHPLK